MDAAAAIRSGDVATLQSLLEQDPSLANARIDERTLLHIVADWPGHLPNGPQMVALLVRFGADLSARMNGETPLHWAASNDDVALVDALLDAGADIEATGAVFTGGAPMSDAVVFAQWNAARRLLERGAKTTYWQAAALGLLDEVRSYESLSADDVSNAFWNACRGGHRDVAEYLLRRGADPNRIGPDDRTPLQVAEESGNRELVEWLKQLA